MLVPCIAWAGIICDIYSRARSPKCKPVREQQMRVWFMGLLIPRDCHDQNVFFTSIGLVASQLKHLS